jgi:hypothetical protein
VIDHGTTISAFCRESAAKALEERRSAISRGRPALIDRNALRVETERIAACDRRADVSETDDPPGEIIDRDAAMPNALTHPPMPQWNTLTNEQRDKIQEAWEIHSCPHACSGDVSAVYDAIRDTLMERERRVFEATMAGPPGEIIRRL